MLVVQPSPYFGCSFQPMFNCVCFPRAYIIIPFDLTNVISLFTWLWKSIFWKSQWIVAESISHLLTSPWFNDEPLFGTRFHSSSPENLRCRFDNLCCTFLLRHPESEVSKHRSYLNLGHIWWLEHFSKSYNTGLLWPNKVMIPSTPGGRTYCYKFFFLARLAILPWGNCKTYSISCSWWILCVPKVWSSPNDHVNAISKHACGTPIFNKNIWSTMLNFLYQLSKHRCMGNGMKFLSPYLKSFLHYILSWIPCSACPWEGYTLEICV